MNSIRDALEPGSSPGGGGDGLYSVQPPPLLGPAGAGEAEGCGEGPRQAVLLPLLRAGLRHPPEAPAPDHQTVPALSQDLAWAEIRYVLMGGNKK